MCSGTGLLVIYARVLFILAWSKLQYKDTGLVFACTSPSIISMKLTQRVFCNNVRQAMSHSGYRTSIILTVNINLENHVYRPLKTVSTIFLWPEEFLIKKRQDILSFYEEAQCVKWPCWLYKHTLNFLLYRGTNNPTRPHCSFKIRNTWRFSSVLYRGSVVLNFKLSNRTKYSGS